ncbi:hypothetical protein M8C21_010795 [Ambrosia artemisiifolia]|uniref:NADP-dependent oxidoreductase domain-containing protein n=1 Tax=Ambrosia artemisiifolia TaxID=4212 RepID=A0AAD5G8J5_AMBAR|nr:hypothetical protein M8C21_010795 [Ambrosia artemisiifolia]
MSDLYGAPKPEPDMFKLIHHAINAGVTLLDTSDVYGPQTNEILLSKALKGGMRDKVELATKFGIKLDGSWEVQGDPAYVRAACEANLKRLEVDFIDLYYQHMIDTSVPIEITIGELKKLVGIGINHQKSPCRASNHCHTTRMALQSRDVDEEIIPTCRELGIVNVAYSPLGRGFFSVGPKMLEKLEESDARKYLPRLQPENLEHIKIMYRRINELATMKGCTTSIGMGNDVVPIPRTTKMENLEHNIGALSIKLTLEDMAELESISSPDSIKGD